MKVINHIHRQNVISNKVNSIPKRNCSGDSTELNSGRKSVEKKMAPVTQKWFLNNDRYTFFFKIDFTFSYFTLRKFALSLKLSTNV